MSDYLNSQNTRLMDPATPGLLDGDTVTLANGAKFALVSGSWEPLGLSSASKQQLVTATPSGSGNVGDPRGDVIRSASGPASVVSDYPVFHRISLKKGVRADVGPNFVSSRDGAGSVFSFAKNGLLRWRRTKVQEQELAGALRVANLAPTNDFTAAGWTKGTGVTLTKLYEEGPNGEISVYRLQRTAGNTGAFLTMNSASYDSGQKTGSIWMSSEAPVSITAEIQEQSGTAIATVTFTPPPRITIDLRAYVSAVITDTTKLYKLQFKSNTAVLDLKIADPSFNDTHGLDPEPPPYVNPLTVYDYGVAGVQYFLEYGHWVPSGVTGFCKRATPTAIDPSTILGYQIQPSWSNRDLYSDDIKNAQWTKVGITATNSGVNAATVFSDSVLFGPGSLMPLIEDGSVGTPGAVGEHYISQVPSGAFESNKVYTRWAYFKADTASQVGVGFKDRDGVRRYVTFDLDRLSVLQTSGSNIVSAGIMKIGDLIACGISDKSGLGAGTMETYVFIANAAGALSYAGTGRRVFVARTCFSKVDHMMVPLSPNTNSVGTGCGTARNGVVLDKNLPAKNVTFFADFVFPEPGYWPARSGWKFILYWISSLRNQWNYVDVRGGMAMRGGPWSGAVVEGFDDPVTGRFVPGQYMFVVDWYDGRSYMDGNGVYRENFSVVMAPVMAMGMKKLRVYFSLRPSDVGTGSNISMRASNQDSYLDVNSDPAIEDLPAGMTMRLGYNEQANSATAQMWISNFNVLGYGMTQAEMAAHLKANPVS